MKKILLCIAVGLFLLASGQSTHAVIGIPDRVPGSTLIVPMFEVGIAEVANPHDTYAVVWNRSGSSVHVHYVIWNVNGLPVWAGNFTLNALATNPLSLRLLINPLTQAMKDQLTDGDFYRGFMTFDEVTGETDLFPVNALYPFASTNSLEGYIYYVRLTQGSSNGMSMIALEAVPSSVSDEYLYGFYGTDNREEIDADARHHVKALSEGLSVPAVQQVISAIHNRVYSVEGTNGLTRLVVFAFPQAATKCFGNPQCGPGPVTSRWYREDGTTLVDGTLTLNRMVYLYTFDSPPGFGNLSGVVSLLNFPNGWEVFAFTINSASPGWDPSISWDAIFESFIDP